jgi:hypothetical protein
MHQTDKLEVYEARRHDGTPYYKVNCECASAPEICERTNPFFVEYKLTEEFRQWLFGHKSYLIKINIDYQMLRVEFPCVTSAMAFKFRWCGY